MKKWMMFLSFWIVSILVYFINTHIHPSDFGDMPILPTSNIQNIELVFHKRIEVKPQSIFYNLIPFKKNFLGFYRVHHNSNKIGLAVFNQNLEMTQILRENLIGEDPRSFTHRNHWYITDNLGDKNKIFLVHQTKDHIELQLQYDQRNKNHQSGKNPTYISYQDELFFLKWFYPLEIYKFGKTKQFHESFQPHQCHFSSQNGIDNKYRGGTPGFATTQENIFIGFGHYTTNDDLGLRHIPFIWKLNMKTYELETRLLTESQFPSRLMDPVTIIHLNGKYYLITAESEQAWFIDQDYITNAWEIIFK